jgi:hypothetical protein
MGASSIGNAPNQPARHGPAYPTRPMREPDPVTSAPRHPFRTSNRPHRAPLSDPKSPVQNRSTFSPPLLVLQFLLLAPSVTPPLRIRSATAIRGGVWAVAIPPVLVVRPPPVRTRLEVCIGPLLRRFSRIPPSRHSTRPCSEQQRSVDPLPQHSGWPASSASNSSGVKWSGRRRQFVDFAVVRLVISM